VCDKISIIVVDSFLAQDPVCAPDSHHYIILIIVQCDGGDVLRRKHLFNCNWWQMLFV